MRAKLLPLFFSVTLTGAVAASAQTKRLVIFPPDLQATIKHEPNSKVVQVLMPGIEMTELDLTQPATNTFQLKSADYNFDGYKDFAFVSPAPTGGMQVYDIFLYHPDAKAFEILEVPGGICETFSNVRLNLAEKTLKTSCRTNTARSSVDLYRWASPYELALATSKDNTAETRDEAAAEKKEIKTEKGDRRKEAREEKADKRKERKEEKEEEDEE